MDDTFLPIAEAAAAAGVPRTTAYRWARTGRVRSNTAPDGTKLVTVAALQAVRDPGRRVRSEEAEDEPTETRLHSSPTDDRERGRRGRRGRQRGEPAPHASSQPTAPELRAAWLEVEELRLATALAQEQQRLRDASSADAERSRAHARAPWERMWRTSFRRWARDFDEEVVGPADSVVAAVLQRHSPDEPEAVVADEIRAALRSDPAVQNRLEDSLAATIAAYLFHVVPAESHGLIPSVALRCARQCPPGQLMTIAGHIAFGQQVATAVLASHAAELQRRNFAIMTANARLADREHELERARLETDRFRRETEVQRLRDWRERREMSRTSTVTTTVSSGGSRPVQSMVKAAPAWRSNEPPQLPRWPTERGARIISAGTTSRADKF